MIRFTVLWRKEVEDTLATLWCDYPRREEISSAADQIDAELFRRALKGRFARWWAKAF